MSAIEWVAAWRAVRGRGWTAVFIVALLGVALAANTIMFAFADSLFFRPVPFAGADRVFFLRPEVQEPDRPRGFDYHRFLQGWREQKDLVEAAGWYQQKTVFIAGDRPLRRVQTLDVTTDFLRVLGAEPRWGRTFADSDMHDTSVFAVVISERLARERFGSPEAAVGKILEATSAPHAVIGVMDKTFAFPHAAYDMWRLLDPVGPLTRDMAGVGTIVRIHPRVPDEEMSAWILDRAPLVGLSAGFPTYTVVPSAFFKEPPAERGTLILMLLGAAICLLAAACANIASLELASSAARSRLAAVQLALGASKWRLARVTAIEGLILTGSGLVLAVGLANLTANLLTPSLPDSLRLISSNPVDFDARSFVAMLAFAALAWTAGTIPAAIATARTSLAELTKSQGTGATSGRSAARSRRVLTVMQVSGAVVLLVGSLLFVRSYRNLLAVDKGFDSAELFAVSWSVPRTFPLGALREKVVRELPLISGIEAVTTSSPPPNPGDDPMPSALEFAGRPPVTPAVSLGRKWVDATYFDVVRMPLRAGRVFDENSAPTDVVVPESFVRRFLPDTNPIDQMFRRTPKEPWLKIIGVVGDFRMERTTMASARSAPYYYALSVPGPAPSSAAAPAVQPLDTGSSTRFLSLTVRTNGRMTTAALLDRVMALDPSVPATVASVDERYAAMSEDTRLASQIVASFGVLAFLIAMAGVFGLMVFLVTARTREIGIRLAIGAEPADVKRMVLTSGFRLVGLGVILGLAGGLAAARAIESQLFGISPADPAVFAVCAVAVLGAAGLALWYPARLASQVDPAVALRHE